MYHEIIVGKNKTLQEQIKRSEIRQNHGLHLSFADIPLDRFWLMSAKNFHIVTNRAVSALPHFLNVINYIKYNSFFVCISVFALTLLKLFGHAKLKLGPTCCMVSIIRGSINHIFTTNFQHYFTIAVNC